MAAKDCQIAQRRGSQTLNRSNQLTEEGGIQGWTHVQRGLFISSDWQIPTHPTRWNMRTRGDKRVCACTNTCAHTGTYARTLTHQQVYLGMQMHTAV